MRTYVVGGAVRDALLGLPVQDRDWVVVGATPEELLARGFRPVGKDFPVFLHPDTGEEYALARTERKSGHGYAGFNFHTSPDVTLEDDLLRRDLTINAIARDVDGTLIDPYGGQADLAARIFRHVSPAFAEDPVRILRVARFAARFADFTIAPDTLALMRHMVENGEADHLVPERVWQELSRGLMAPKPSRMILTLRQCGALAVVLPEVERFFARVHASPHPMPDVADHVMAVIDQAAQTHQPLAVRWACLLRGLDEGVTARQDCAQLDGHHAAGIKRVEAVSHRLKVPNDCRDLAVMLARERGMLHCVDTLCAESIVTLLERTDVFRRPERFELLLDAVACDLLARPGSVAQAFTTGTTWRGAMRAARAVDAGEIARLCEDRRQIPQRIHEARVCAVKTGLAG